MNSQIPGPTDPRKNSVYPEYWLDLFDIHVPKNTLDLILLLMQVHCGSHAGIRKCSPNCFVDQGIVLHVIELAKVPDNLYLGIRGYSSHPEYS